MTTTLKGLNILGINEREQQIYEVLVELGTASAADLAIASGIKRSTVYLYVDKLKTEGLIVESIRNSKKYFSAVPPKNLHEIVRSRIKQLRVLDQNIDKIKNPVKKSTSKNSTSYSVYRGLPGLLSIVSDVVASGEEFYFLGNNKDLNKFITQEFWEKFYIRPRRKRMKTEYMITTSRAPKTVARFFEESGTFTKIRFLPEELDFQGAIAAYGNKLIIGKYSPEPVGVAFEDKKLVEIFKMAFFALWKDLEGKNVPTRN